MPRANRHRVPGQVWHITDRCHRQQLLLKFAKNRPAWVGWLHEARQRFGLCVLNYQVTSNHAHLLVLDRGRGEIAPSMQLIAGRTGQDYNRRTRRRGAFWQESVPRHDGGHRRVPGALSGVHRPEHGARRSGAPSARVEGSWVP